MNRRELLKLGAAMAVAPGLPVAKPAIHLWPAQQVLMRELLVVHVPRVAVFGFVGFVGIAGTMRTQLLNEATGLWEDV